MKKQILKGKELKKDISKTNNGITLIALVITVIVLLILAGVTIATLTGDNGILTKVTEAKNKNIEGEEKEAIGLAYSGVMADNNGTGVSDTELQTELTNNGYTTTVIENGDGTLVVTFASKNEYIIDSNGNISGPTLATNIVATMKIAGEKVTNPPMPSSDFTHIEGTVDTGYVIQDSNGNQFVWVPVDQNQKIQINVTSKEGDIESLVLTDPYGEDILTLSSLGTSYSNTNVDPTINGPYRLAVTAGGETKKVFLNVHSLYAVDSFADWEATEEYAKSVGYDSLEDFVATIGCSSVEEYMFEGGVLTKGNPAETEDYTDSVNTNGGFYIGRYEASYEDGKAVSKVSKSIRTSESTKLINGMLWNYIKQEDALSNVKSMYTSLEFTSSLLTGAASDRTLGWLYQTGAVSWQEIVIDSSNWGNYLDETFSASLSNTGSITQTEKNHIYDLAGNLREWTTETYDGFYRIVVGRWLQQLWLRVSK